MTGARVRAFAKINVSLRVLGVRADGYHELHTIFQSIALHDTLTFRRRVGPFALTCSDEACPADERNLVWRAAAAMWKASGRRGDPHGIRVHLTKRIPMEAGLGGGSSDAAAALRAFARLWRVSARDQQAIGERLGADVPYFFAGGTALGVNRGDRLTALPDRSPEWVVVAVPRFGVSTKEAFAWFDAAPPAADASSLQAPGSTAHKKVIMRNDLEAVVAERHPEIGRLVRALRRHGADHAAMSGSGSAVFGLFRRRSDAVRAFEALAARARRASTCLWLTRTVPRERYRTLAATQPIG